MSKEILEGLKRATEKGESLQQAMMSFLNAGYSREEIENAARELQKVQTGKPVDVIGKKVKETTEKVKKSIAKQKKVLPKVSNYGVEKKEIKKPVQQVSKYTTSKPKTNSKQTPLWIIIILAVILLVLLGVLAGVLFFKEELIEFLSNYFG